VVWSKEGLFLHNICTSLATFGPLEGTLKFSQILTNQGTFTCFLLQPPTVIALVSAKFSSLDLRGMLRDMAVVVILKTPITRFIQFREGALIQGISYGRNLSFEFEKPFYDPCGRYRSAS
jgi:hypothetical protein